VILKRLGVVREVLAFGTSETGQSQGHLNPLFIWMLVEDMAL
jgi:hypothetical protein